MSKKLYVGNLAFGTTDDDLRQLFGQYGAVVSASVVTDRDTGRSRGFGFVEMSDGAEAAIDGTNGREFQGRTLFVGLTYSFGGGRRPRDQGFDFGGGPP